MRYEGRSGREGALRIVGVVTALVAAGTLTASLGACERHSSGAAAPLPPAEPVATAAAPAPASAAPAVAAASAEPVASAPRGVACGELGCEQFDSARDAFLAAIAGDARVLAIGEAHAQKGATAPSAAKRFTDELLPALAGRASDLLVELMMPPRGCADAAAEVRKKQAPATSQQAATNQNEYVTMGDRARALGIVPDLLRPSCVDMDAVNKAGDGAIEASLAMIARLSAAQAGKLLDRDASSAADRAKAVVVYGGMLHNDLAPSPERAKWSYATVLDERTGGKVVSVDLVVPEFITSDAIWKELPWVARYDRAKLGGKATLFRVGERSFVLVFAATQ